MDSNLIQPNPKICRFNPFGLIQCDMNTISIQFKIIRVRTKYIFYHENLRFRIFLIKVGGIQNWLYFFEGGGEGGDFFMLPYSPFLLLLFNLRKNLI